MDQQLGQFEMVVRRDGVRASATVILRGELDLHGAGILGDRVADLIEWGVPAIEIDASELAFIDSSGLKALLDARQAAEDARVEFSVRSASARLVWVTNVTGMSDLLLSA